MLHELRTIDGLQPSTVRSNVFHPLVVTDQYQETDTFQQWVEKSLTAIGDISNNWWRYFQQPLNYSFFQWNLLLRALQM